MKNRNSNSIYNLFLNMSNHLTDNQISRNNNKIR